MVAKAISTLKASKASKESVPAPAAFFALSAPATKAPLPVAVVAMPVHLAKAKVPDDIVSSPFHLPGIVVQFVRTEMEGPFLQLTCKQLWQGDGQRCGGAPLQGAAYC